MSNVLIEQLIDAQIDFLKSEFSKSAVISTEFEHFYTWFKSKKLADIWSAEQIYQLLQTQILDTPASSFLVEQIAEHIRFALIHPANDNTRIEDIIPVTTIDQIAQYIASKSSHRKALIKRISNNPAFASMMSQLIQHAIQDYMDNSILNKKVPGVGRFMKMGKSMLESVTDSSLDETVSGYLQKNIHRLSLLTENLINQHFSDEKLYQFQATLWHKIKKLPVGVLRQYIDVNDLPNTVGLGHDIWEHLRQSDYLKQQLRDGIFAWYARNESHLFDSILGDLNINSALIHHELNTLLIPIIQQLICSDYFENRARQTLEKFYYSEPVVKILEAKHESDHS